MGGQSRTTVLSDSRSAAQETRDVGCRDVGGVPKRHPGRNQFQARVAGHGQQVGRAVGDGNVTHAGGEIGPEDLVQLRWRRSPSTATTKCPGVASAHAVFATTLDLPSRGAHAVNAMTGACPGHDVEVAVELLERLETALVGINVNMSAGSAPAWTSTGTSPRTGRPNRSDTSSAATNLRKAPAAKAAKTAKIKPSATAATATVPWGFVGVVGSAAGPNWDSTRTACPPGW